MYVCRFLGYSRPTICIFNRVFAVPFLLITRTTTYLSRYCTIMHLYLILSFISALKLQFSTHMERFPIPLPSHKNRNFQKE